MCAMLKHPLFVTLKNLEGNPRAVVYTEPMWGIPFSLYSPYVSVYMLALGVSDAQIGIIASLGLVVQTIFALLSGAITDKMGRRFATMLFDILGWTIPGLIWVVAQDLRYFIVAALFNAMWRIPANSWICLMVEDAKKEQLVHIWTWIYIAGLLSAFFAPLAGLLINAIDLVPAMRILYLFATVMMTLKALILYRYSTETEQGRLRQEETRSQPLFSLLRGYRGVFKQILRTPRTLVVLAIGTIMSIVWMVNGNFWSIIVTEHLGIPAEHLALYPFSRSVLMLVLYFVLVPRLNLRRFRNPMLLGLAGLLVSQLLLITIPEKNYWLLLVSVLIDAFSVALFNPLMDSLTVVSIASEERARINAIMAVIIILLTSPFGWIAGQLSEISRLLPFVLNICLFGLATGLVLLAWRFNQHQAQAESRPQP